MALENNVALISHDHGGVTGGTNRILQANSHQSADTDSSTSSLHHTIGSGSTQSAAGNHTHPPLSPANNVIARYAATVDQTLPNVTNVVLAFGGTTISTSLVTRNTNSTGHSFTMNLAGVWLIEATVRGRAVAGGEAYCGIIYNGGSTVLAADGAFFGNYPGTRNPVALNYFNLGDFITVQYFQSSGGTITTDCGSGWVSLSLAWLHY